MKRYYQRSSENPIYRIMARRLRHARRRAGYRSARAFAQTHGLAVTSYSNHESCKRGLTIPVALHYSRLLNISVCWLITGN